MKAQAAVFQVTLLIGIMALIIAIPFQVAAQFQERQINLNTERFSLIRAINSFELFMSSLENALFVSTAQVVFGYSEIHENNGYWYNYNPTDIKNIQFPESGCSGNPTICLLTVEEISAFLTSFMNVYTNEIQNPINSNNAVININNIENSVFVSHDGIKSFFNSIVSSDTGKSKIERREQINTTLVSNFKQMLFAGYLVVENAVEISQKANSDYLRYEPINFANLDDKDLPSNQGNEKFIEKASINIETELNDIDFFNLGNRILVIEIDPEGAPEDNSDNYETEVRRFHLTNVKNYFTGEVTFALDDHDLNSNPGSECIVFSVNEHRGSNSDHGSVWYIRPGGRIPKTGKIYDGIKDHVVQESCEQCSGGDFCIEESNDRCGNEGQNDGKASYKFIANKETIGGEPFTDNIHDQHCVAENCILLKQNEKGEYYYEPKHELLCDNSGFWQICDSSFQGAEISIGNKIYSCRDDLWTSTEITSSSGNIELMVSTDSTNAVLPNQGGLVLKYDKTVTLNEEAKYYRDTGSSFEKIPFSLNVKVKDFLPVLDCNEYATGTRFKWTPDRGNNFNLDLMCHSNQIYGCNINIPGFSSSNDKNSGDNVGGDPQVGNDGSYILDPNKYQCVPGNGNIFCQLHKDGIKSDSRFKQCCENWKHDIEPIKNQPSKWYGNFCVGDTIKDSGETCDTRKVHQSTGKGIPNNGGGYQFWCDNNGHKYDCLSNPSNMYETRGNPNPSNSVNDNGEAICDSNCDAQHTLNDLSRNECLWYNSCIKNDMNFHCNRPSNCNPCDHCQYGGSGSCNPGCMVIYTNNYCESRDVNKWCGCTCKCNPPPPPPSNGGSG